MLRSDFGTIRTVFAWKNQIFMAMQSGPTRVRLLRVVGAKFHVLYEVSHSHAEQFKRHFTWEEVISHDLVFLCNFRMEKVKVCMPMGT